MKNLKVFAALLEALVVKVPMLVTGLESEFMISLKKGYKRPFHFLVPL